MRLINAATLELQVIPGEPTGPRFPRYAILSHTWGTEEVTLQDMQNPEVAKKKAGFGKIAKCCELALDEGLSWAWVDTCCIDKTSSAELSEAINSMFKWYECSTVCYAYLSDVRDAGSDTNSELKASHHYDWRQSRWFTRGWTLQELIAPYEVVLYDHKWKQLGTKRRLSKELEERTRIPQEVLLDPAARRNKSVAARMSWAKGRQTTRVEDRTYSLLGLFDIAMPLLYGEGEKALSRLQVEILAAIEDDTIFLGGLTSTDHDLGEWPHTALEHLTMEQDFLATPENIFAEFPTMVRPLPNITGSLHAATQVMSQSNPYINSSGRVQRDEPRKDPKLRGDVLSMPMRVIQVLFSDRPPARTPITQKKQFRVQITPTSQSILEAFGSNSVNSNNASLCLGLLRCGKDDRLIARYFMCLLVNDELYAFPTPFYRFVSPPEASYWPYIECHILLDKGVWKPTPYLTHLRDPAGWNLPAAKPNTNFGNGWTWSTWGKEEQGVNTNMAFQISNETILSYRLCFDEGNEIWNLTLTLGSDDTDSFGRTKAVKVEIRLQCVTSPGLDAEVMTASHRRREGPVTELCKRMRTSGGSAELVVSVYYGVESGQHYYSPMIRFRAFEARNLGRK